MPKQLDIICLYWCNWLYRIRKAAFFWCSFYRFPLLHYSSTHCHKQIHWDMIEFHLIWILKNMKWMCSNNYDSLQEAEDMSPIQIVCRAGDFGMKMSSGFYSAPCSARCTGLLLGGKGVGAEPGSINWWFAYREQFGKWECTCVCGEQGRNDFISTS